MLAQDMFEIGDIVCVRPYQDIEDHYSIPKNAWDDFYENNPHQIVEFTSFGNAVLDFDRTWAWLDSALELSYEKNMPDIIDMI